MSEDNPEEEKEKPERKFSQEQYDMLRRCSEKGDMTEWDEWREANPDEEILLQGADLREANLQKADLRGANLEGAILGGTHLQKADLRGANLQGAILYETNLQGAQCRAAIVDGSSCLLDCIVDQDTDFREVGLDSARVEPGLKQLLKHNTRRKQWQAWYEKHFFLQWPVRAFWWMSDYGRSTGRIIGVFFGLALLFAFIYWLFPSIVFYLSESGGEEVPPGRIPLRALYFSIVTMTTLGFGDMHAADNVAGYFLLTLQVLLGYALLGALVTRFAVLFQAEGPAGKFAKEEKRKKGQDQSDADA